MTYGRPDDTRRPSRSPAPDEPAGYWSDPYGSPPASSPSGAYDSGYGSTYESGYDSTYGSGHDAPTNGGAAPYSSGYPYESSQPTAATYAASSPSPYPGADSYLTDSYAPERYTSFEADPMPAVAEPGGAPPSYVRAGLYLDEDRGRAGEYPGGADNQTAAVRPATGLPAAAEPPSPKGGRNLPAAIGVGVSLGVVVLATLFFWKPAFFAVIAVAVAVAVWELVRAVSSADAHPPLIPLVAGGIVTTALAWWGGADALTFGLVVTVLAAMVWRLAHGTAGYARDVTFATLIAVYVPFLGGFAAMLSSPDDGARRILAALIAVVLSDTGGYIVGARFGRHPMAPSVSPKKSWEGFGGSLAAAGLGSAVALLLMFGVALWSGLLFGIAIAIASVVGDLGESMIKRSLGVKDMSNLLPGHGGVMDRLDSVLFAAPVAYLLLSVMVPI